MLTARADQYLWGRPDLAEVIRRAQAFETAGANAIMVPGLSDHGHRCTRQLHRSLADVRRGGFSWTAVLNAAVNRKAAIKHRTPYDRRNTFSSGHQARCTQYRQGSGIRWCVLMAINCLARPPAGWLSGAFRPEARSHRDCPTSPYAACDGTSMPVRTRAAHSWRKFWPFRRRRSGVRSPRRSLARRRPDRAPAR